MQDAPCTVHRQLCCWAVNTKSWVLSHQQREDLREWRDCARRQPAGSGSQSIECALLACREETGRHEVLPAAELLATTPQTTRKKPQKLSRACSRPPPRCGITPASRSSRLITPRVLGLLTGLRALPPQRSAPSLRPPASSGPSSGPHVSTKELLGLGWLGSPLHRTAARRTWPGAHAPMPRAPCVPRSAAAAALELLRLAVADAPTQQHCKRHHLEHR